MRKYFGWKIHILKWLVRFSVGAGNFSLRHCVQTGSGAHPLSSSMGTRGSLPGSKAAGTWSWPLTSFRCRGPECVALYLHPPNTSSMALCL